MEDWACCCCFLRREEEEEGVRLTEERERKRDSLRIVNENLQLCSEREEERILGKEEGRLGARTKKVEGDKETISSGSSSHVRFESYIHSPSSPDPTLVVSHNVQVVQ